jgi:hypothetical protein
VTTKIIRPKQNKIKTPNLLASQLCLQKPENASWTHPSHVNRFPHEGLSIRGGRNSGLIRMADEIRSNTRDFVKTLRDMGIRPPRPGISSAPAAARLTSGPRKCRRVRQKASFSTPPQGARQLGAHEKTISAQRETHYAAHWLFFSTSS